MFTAQVPGLLLGGHLKPLHACCAGASKRDDTVRRAGEHVCKGVCRVLDLTLDPKPCVKEHVGDGTYRVQVRPDTLNPVTENMFAKLWMRAPLHILPYSSVCA